MKEYAYSRVETFSVKGNGNWNARIEYQVDGKTTFSCSYNGKELGDFTISMIGSHNVRNALASIACAHHSGISIEDIQAGLLAFIPPKRRLEIIFASYSKIKIR